MAFSVIFDGQNLWRLLGGLWVTARIALISAAVSMVLGVFFGITMNSKHKGVRFLCRFYLEAWRIVPVLVWLFLIYFGLSRNFSLNLSGEAASILVFTLWGTAEMGDLVRGAVSSIERHQYEAGFALGLSEAQVHRFIVVPQAVRRLVPGAINLITRMIKTTSFVPLIGVVEVIKVGQQIIESNFLIRRSTGDYGGNEASIWIYGFIFILYFLLCAPVSHLSKALERRMA